MARFFSALLSCFTLCWCLAGSVCLSLAAEADAEVKSEAEAFVKAFNQGKAEAVVELFAPEAELIDENGNLYKGKEELQKLFSGYFAKFPGATLVLDVESIRLIGSDLSMEDGTRYLSSKDEGKAQVRYATVRTKKDGKWRIASVREFYDEPAPTNSQRLAALDWLVGDWASEDSDVVVKMSYRWTDDKNFIEGSFRATRGGEEVMKSTQRIGWDPVAGKVRSWLFDADGGFSEGSWTNLEDAWVIKSQATMPDGTTGSATITILPKGKNQFTMRGTDRLIGDGRGDDFDITVVRAPPAPKSAAVPNGASAPPAIRNSIAPTR
ncbi:SnoaL-like domain protein [Anatilimnocola aggregata]|uniref:SnoaL-like domain protein n=1 Tax=Anatilimnocola aggregata TaxID=2528021 RepID=A0A517YNF6_9BACT|nr:SgcJ/EcaC family oxidoreductase [Anatilimnocola aggregata]QDU31755.1 SnoaL-like domain protein [Anatilimnocola aggregata]